MTDKEKAIVMAHTGICMLTGDKFQIFHKYVEDIMNRPIMTHELGWLEDEIKEKSKADFMALCANESGSEKPNKSENPTSSTTKNDLAVEKIIDEVEKEFEKVDIPIMDKLTIFAKVQNALYKCAVSNNSVGMIRPKGHWIDTDATHSKCSRCWAVFEIASANGKVNYCPNCGAKMEGEA